LWGEKKEGPSNHIGWKKGKKKNLRSRIPHRKKENETAVPLRIEEKKRRKEHVSCGRVRMFSFGKQMNRGEGVLGNDAVRC